MVHTKRVLVSLGAYSFWKIRVIMSDPYPDLPYLPDEFGKCGAQIQL